MDPFASPATDTQKKSLFSRRLSVWLCRDLLPFSIVNGEGFKDWMISNGYIKDHSELPNERTLANSALNDIFVIAEKRFKEKVADAPEIILCQLDYWTSQNGCVPYITIAIQYVDDNFILHALTMCTEKYARPHSSARTGEIVTATLQKNGLGDRKIIGSGDHGSNLINLPNHVQNCIAYIDCIAHSIHLIFSADMPKHESWEVVSQVLKKIKAAHGALCYRLHELKEHFLQMQKIEINDYLCEIEEMIEAIKADEIFGPHADILNTNEIVAEEYYMISSGMATYSSFSKDNATRWFSASDMLNTYDKNYGLLLFKKI